ncbi:MAG TPA: hypothetical protein PLM53_17455 [Spirochaetota bacterium]|nr:hypothetical protein [Spirochaetota bacterium]HPC41333.1 hypothetical protein [Spirochaetota bacterium]HPL15428.1 hypothetical protein [Spirochaetota bacterium]HQF09736.1 hypothetical protein [Spirochaetota bacterium]HQH98885.1 hypothetical protein [Spirochaetota bacterium]
MKLTHIIISLILALIITFPPTVFPDVAIPAKAKIKIFWRYVPAAMNPLDIRTAFRNSGTITASKSPSGGGSITGRQVIALIKKKSIDKVIVRCRAISLKEGQDPSNLPTLASIAVRDDNSIYDNYVIRTGSGDLALFVDVLIAQ